MRSLIKFGTLQQGFTGISKRPNFFCTVIFYSIKFPVSTSATYLIEGQMWYQCVGWFPIDKLGHALTSSQGFSYLSVLKVLKWV